MPAIRPLISLSIASLCLISCATSYDPTEVCTTNWIKPRAERAIADIETDTGSILKNIRKTASSYAKGKTPNPLQLLSLTASLTRLTDTLENGRGVKDLKILSETCNDPQIISDSLSQFFRDQGLPSQVIDFMEDMDIYQKILTSNPSQRTG